MKPHSSFSALVGIVVLMWCSSLLAQGTLPPREKIDTTAIAQIKDEGMNRSQVMEILSYLTDVYGPRLTGSPEYKQAADWASAKLRQWGVQNVHYEKWGPFGKGWTLKRFSANLTEPRAFPLIAYPKAWSLGTRGTVEGEVIYLNARSDSELATYQGKLEGKFVLISDPRELKAHFQPEGWCLADSSLLKLANADIPTPGQQRRRFPPMQQLSPAARDSVMRMIFRQFMPNADSITIERAIEVQRMAPKKLELCQSEGAVAVLDEGRGDDGTLFVQSAVVPQPPGTPYYLRVNPYSENAPKLVPQVTVAAEHYNRMIRMIQKGQKLEMEMDLDVEFTPVDSSFNIIGEIPGTDLKDEVVMIGGHFDSWHAGTGATDNGTGSAVCMEAMRILESLGLKPRRTIRIGLWGGEEEGLLGSRAYVSRHLGEREGGAMGVFGGVSGNIKTKPEYEKFSVYFNNDNGTGKVRGVYMQGNEAARPIFRAWLEPFASTGASTLTLSNTGGTDHLSFDAIGLPGFQFIQDPIEYEARTHHTNMDVCDRAQEGDLKQAAVIMASFAYNAATRDEKFPRKPMPQPTSGAAGQ
jgi:carboxypeptidase Q